MCFCLYSKERVSVMELPEKDQVSYWLYMDVQGKKDAVLEVTYRQHCWYWKGNARYHETHGSVSGSLTTGCIYHFEGMRSLSLLLQRKKTTSTYIALLHQEETISIGRGSDCQIQYQQPYVSKRQALLYADQGKWKLQDTNSRNGVYVNQLRIDHHDMTCGDVIHMMGIQLVFGDGFLVIPQWDHVAIHGIMPYQIPQITTAAFQTSRKRMLPPSHKQHSQDEASLETKPIIIEGPASPETAARTPLWLLLGPSLTMGISSIAMGVSAWIQAVMMKQSVWQSVPSLIMAGGMAASTILWPILTQRHEMRARKRRVEHYQKRYLQYLGQKQEQIDQYIRNYQLQQKQACKYLLIENQELDMQNSHLWQLEKEDDVFLQLLLGKGKTVLSLPLDYQKPEFLLQEDDVFHAFQAIIAQQETMVETYLRYDLRQYRGLDIIGEKSLQVLMQLLLQITKSHTPMQVKIVLIMEEMLTRSWKLRFLPHLFSQDGTKRYLFTEKDRISQIISIFEEEAHQDSPCAFITIVQLPDGFDLPWHQLLKQYPFLYLIRQSDTPLTSIGEFPYIQQMKDSQFFLHSGKQKTRLHIPLLTPHSIKEQLQHLALFQPQTTQPSTSAITFLDLYRCGLITQLDLAGKWNEHKEHTLRVKIGKNAHGNDIYLDAHEAHHGPHGLIAGMTGSGKSEFLMTYVLSLCIQYSCEDITFVLIDYKGGMMAEAFHSLPHISYIMTNLKEGEMYRFARALDHELMYRQQIFQDVKQRMHRGVMDMDTYQKLYHQSIVHTPMPHLFLIADEFAELKTQQPEFMEQLKQVARIGRSLGVHLILSTQKPYGVIDDQIWSNARFHVCLKVQDRNDSVDMLKKEDACRLQQPGEFYLQVGNDELFVKGRSSYTQAPYVPREAYLPFAQKEATILDDQLQPLASKRLAADNSTTKTQLEAVIEHIHEQSKRCTYQPYHLLYPAIQPGTMSSLPDCAECVLGMIDDVACHDQYPLTLDIISFHHLLLAGKPGSGKRLFLEQLLLECLRLYHQKELAIYILDGFRDHMEEYVNQAIIADVITIEQEEKMESLLYQCTQESFFKHADQTILLLHGYEFWKEAYPSLEDVVKTLLPQANSLHLHLIITTLQPSSLAYRLMNWFDELFLLQLQERSEYALLLDPLTLLPLPQRGSGIHVCSSRHLLFQILPYDELIKQELLAHTSGESPWRIPVLPTHILPQYRNDALYLGKDMQSKQDCWIDLRQTTGILFCQAFTINEGYLHYFKQWQSCYDTENNRCVHMTYPAEEVDLSKVAVWFVHLVTLQALQIEPWFLRMVYEGDVVWRGKGLEEAAHILKLPMECMSHPLAEDEILWYRKGECRWIKGMEAEMHG